MKILLITTLYPGNKLQTRAEASFALRSFSKEWNKYSEILVIRPISYKINDIVSKDKNIKIYVELIDSIKVVSVPVFHNYVRGWGHRTKICKLLSELCFWPDIILGHMPYSNYVSYLVSRKMRKPLVIGLHESDFVSKRFGVASKIGQKMICFANGISCRSPSIQTKLREYNHETNNKQFIAISGINKKHILNKEIFQKKISSWKSVETIHFSTVAYLDRIKNVDVNLRALKKLDCNGGSWKYSVVGSGEELLPLEQLALDLGIEKQVHFYGALNHKETIAILRESHVFVMVSLETLGLAYLEAMATGNIVIGRAGTGIDGIIIDNVNGLLSDSDNVMSLWGKMHFLLNECDFDYRDKLLNNSYQTIIELSQEKMAKKYYSFLRKTARLASVLQNDQG